MDILRSESLSQLRAAVRAYADRHANVDGVATTPVTGLRMMRVYEPSKTTRSIYKPLVCLVLQGAKHLVIGREERIVEAGETLVAGVDMPVIGRVVRASKDQPYLAVAMELDVAVMQELALEVPSDTASSSISGPTLFSTSFDADVLSCALRMMRLIDHPEAVPVLRPAILRELHYWLLRSPYGPALRSMIRPDSVTQRIAATIELIRRNYARPISIEELASRASMSTSAFHRRFKALTSISPLQFQKQLRLLEARRMMMNEGLSATRAASLVGYESVSQFTREYRRMFGVSPKRDVSRRLTQPQEPRAPAVALEV
ncbi:MAG: AraC family transcriptional regulator [Gammaproteobacteria bacterium]